MSFNLHLHSKQTPFLYFGLLTPYKKLFHQPPSYDNLRSFGCLAYMSQYPSNKLSPRALKTVFIGYSLLQKGYNLYDIETQTIHVSRHVVCHEDVFPFSQISTSSDDKITPTSIDLCHEFSTPLDSLQYLDNSISTSS